MILYEYFSEKIVYAFGWTIFHSLWQGTSIAVVLAILLVCTRRYTSRTRYFLATIALFLFAGMAVMTFVGLCASYVPDNSVSSVPIAGMKIAPVTLMVGPTFSQDYGQGSLLTTVFSDIRTYFNTNLPAIVMIWLFGLLLLTMKFMGEFLYTRKLRRYQTISLPDIWRSHFEELCAKNHIRKTVSLMESALVQVPVVIGYFKPMILLPIGAILGLPSAQVDAILAHELAHIRRNDYLVNILQSFIEILFFYHPAVWWISSRMRAEREHCCDDSALAFSGDPLVLAKALASLEERVHNSRLVLAATGNSSLFHRIRRIAGRPNTISTSAEKCIAVAVLALGIILMSMSASASMGGRDNLIVTYNYSEGGTDPVGNESTSTDTTQSRSHEQISHERSKNVNFLMETDKDGKQHRIEFTAGKNGSISDMTIDSRAATPEEIEYYSEKIKKLWEQDQELRKKDEELHKQDEELRKQDEELRKKDDLFQQQEQVDEHNEETEDTTNESLEEEIDNPNEFFGSYNWGADSLWGPKSKEMEKQLQQMQKYQQNFWKKNQPQWDKMMKQYQKKMEVFGREMEKWGKQFQKQYEHLWNDSLLQWNMDHSDEMRKFADTNRLFSQNIQKEAMVRQKEAAVRQKEAMVRQKEAMARQKEAAVRQQEAIDRQKEAVVRQEEAKIRQKEAVDRQKQWTSFSEAMESELLKDNLIESKETYGMKLNSKELYINGKKQPQNVFEKYKSLYESHTGKTLGNKDQYQVQRAGK